MPKPKSFVVSAKWKWQLNDGWLFVFDPSEGLAAKQRFATDSEAIAQARRLTKLGAMVRIDEESQ